MSSAFINSGLKSSKKSPCSDVARLTATYACPLVRSFLKDATTLSKVAPCTLCIVQAQQRTTGNCILVISGDESDRPAFCFTSAGRIGTPHS